MVNKKRNFRVQEMLPYKDIEHTIDQLESDDAQTRADALNNIKSYGEIASYKLIEKIKNNPYKIDSYIVIALDELGNGAYAPVIQHLSNIKRIRSLKDLIFLETIIEVAKDIFSEKDKELLYKLLAMIEKVSVKRIKNKLFQSFCKNLKIKIFECLFKFNDITVYKYVLRELQKDSISLTNIIVDILKKFADTEIVHLLLEVYKSETGISESNARLVKNIVKSVYKRSKTNFETFAFVSNITNTRDLNILNSILR